MRIIKTIGQYRIIEEHDLTWDYDNLAGDSFKPEVNPNIPEHELARQEKHFIDEISDEGVYGYMLQRWNPEIDVGWEHVNSCWGFVGSYTSEDEHEYNHYIVKEFENKINDLINKRN